MMLKLAASSLLLAALTAAAMPAARHAARAEKALAGGKLEAAVTSAEAAVVASPRDAEFRMLLGRAYLKAGRYSSAAASFADVLALNPNHGSAALSLALTRIGLGEQDRARSVLDTHGADIPAGDRGLALALAGDAATGVALLEAEVRGGGTDAKTRQNLALSYALAGRWAEAQLMASYDLDPATLAHRIMDWSRFAREQQASAQVAALLGVAPGADPGQPAQLALHVDAPKVQLAAAVPPPPVRMGETAPAEAEAISQIPAIRFAERAEVVQPLALPIVKTSPRPAPVVRAREIGFVRPTGGRFVVQLGAFDSEAVAQAAWERLAARIFPLRDITPFGAAIVRGEASFHRLSVGGFATRSVAVSFCEQLRARGGQCFVREAAGDAPLQWAQRGGNVRVAAR